MGKKHKIGLVLSGGAARGFAHIGIFKAMEEQGIRPGIIAGTSAGAIIGSLYADGHKADEILSMFLDKPLSSFWRLKIPRSGLVKATGLARTLKENYRSKTLSGLETEFIAAATNLNTGKAVYFSEGELFKVVMASACIPVVFNPVKINGYQYVDGGVTDNLPLAAVADKCRHTIGVNVNPVGEMKELDGIFDIAFRAFHLSLDAKVDHQRERFDLYTEPPGLEEYGLLNVKKGFRMYQLGYKAMKKLLQENERKIKRW